MTAHASILSRRLFCFFQTHNDYIPYQLNRPCGVRVLTFYIYLNDVEEGGGTNFPHIDATVSPKRGRAVLWPSVFNEDPHIKDTRSDHQAMPVIQGVKYGAVSLFENVFLVVFEGRKSVSQTNSMIL